MSLRKRTDAPQEPAPGEEPRAPLSERRPYLPVVSAMATMLLALAGVLLAWLPPVFGPSTPEGPAAADVQAINAAQEWNAAKASRLAAEASAPEERASEAWARQEAAEAAEEAREDAEERESAALARERQAERDAREAEADAQDQKRLLAADQRQVERDLRQMDRELAQYDGPLRTGPNAKVASDGTAIAPEDAPQRVKEVIAAGNKIARTPYKWGGGHGSWKDSGYDCSGSVSYALRGGGMLRAPMASGGFMRWGAPGPGKWITIFAQGGHMYMEVAGLRFDTSAAKSGGSRWTASRRSSGGFSVRHPPGF